MPGSGKSSFGKRLASRLSWKFTDLDNVITAVSGKSPQEWIEQESEASFRIIERDTLHNLDRNVNQIVACGGGTPCFYGNLEYMQFKGFCIYLSMPPAAIVSRLKQSQGWEKRPLLGDNPGSIDQKIADLWNTRKVFYESIDYKVDGMHLDLEVISLEINQYFARKS